MHRGEQLHYIFHDVSSIIHYVVMSLQVGITGGIGSGKSVVCRIFSALGAPIYEADERAKWLTEHDPILKADIVRLLGNQAYDRSSGPGLGHYNRAWVASQVFADPDLLTQLNALIHPRVAADSAAWVARHAHKPYVVKEAALMNAAGHGNTLDRVIVVQAPLALRIERVARRDPHRSPLEIQRIIDRQISDGERMKIADYTLNNDENRLLLPQVVALHAGFVSFGV